MNNLKRIELSLPPIDQIDAEIRRRECSSDLYAFRKHLFPKLIDGWWQRQLAKELQQFKDDLFAGLAPMLVIQAPPQHGKSVQIQDAIAWIVGHNPDLKCIYASFSERLGVRANLRLQRVFDNHRYASVFPDTSINSSNVVTISGQHLRNREILEFVGREGYFRNTTVRGSITGEGLDLGILDDPIKGREEANSQTVRDKTWDWLMDDFFTRFSEKAGFLSILTRWHIDDPIGRLIEKEPRCKVLSYPALAVEKDRFRGVGDALFQQSPVITGGNMFKQDDLLRHTDVPRLSWRAVYVDTAQKTKERNDFSVFQHWGAGVDGKAYLLDQARGRFEAPELEKTALTFWNKARLLDTKFYGTLRKMDVEDKVSGTGLIQVLKRKSVPVVARQRGTDKYTRALDVVPSVAAGLVSIPNSEVAWVKDWLLEYLSFPDGKFDDQMDPFMDAVSDMCGVTGYTLDNL